MKALAAAIFLVSAMAFSSSDKSAKVDPSSAGATSAVAFSSATKNAAKQYLEKFIADNNIPGVLIQVTTPARSIRCFNAPIRAGRMEPKGFERHRWVKPRGREERERISQSAVADALMNHLAKPGADALSC